jgi:hypothetical protein
MATVLTLIHEILERKEQAVVFSAFNDPLDNLSRWLAEAGVRHVTLDGRVNQKRRGEMAALFKKGRLDESSLPVMLAGVECMAEGHSFHLANNVILLAYSWAYDKFKQALDRVHRMNSIKPVNVDVVLCSGTIDRKLESLVQEKSDAAELVLDGQLIGERTEEINLAQLLKVARRDFNEKDNTLDEARLQAEWPKLRGQLASAMQRWEADSIGATLQAVSTVPAPAALPARLLTLPVQSLDVPLASGPQQPATFIRLPLPAQIPLWQRRLKERRARHVIFPEQGTGVAYLCGPRLGAVAVIASDETTADRE